MANGAISGSPHGLDRVWTRAQRWRLCPATMPFWPWLCVVRALRLLHSNFRMSSRRGGRNTRDQYAPLFRHRPPERWTNGDLAAKVGIDLGLPPDDEQRELLDMIYAEGPGPASRVRGVCGRSAAEHQDVNVGYRGDRGHVRVRRT